MEIRTPQQKNAKKKEKKMGKGWWWRVVAGGGGGGEEDQSRPKGTRERRSQTRTRERYGGAIIAKIVNT